MWRCSGLAEAIHQSVKVWGRWRECSTGEKFEKMSSKPEVLKHLQEGFAYGRQAVATLDEAKIIGLT